MNDQATWEGESEFSRWMRSQHKSYINGEMLEEIPRLLKVMLDEQLKVDEEVERKRLDLAKFVKLAEEKREMLAAFFAKWQSTPELFS